ncbi:hypothetical protein TNCV_3525931 [Trichonephila clavipes]|nr:hypothetical protein TNCV_3525931 [Trichonephila clavipes]
MNETPATVEPNATASTPATVESDPTASTPTQPSTRSGHKVHLPTSVIYHNRSFDRDNNLLLFKVIGSEIKMYMHIQHIVLSKEFSEIDEDEFSENEYMLVGNGDDLLDNEYECTDTDVEEKNIVDISLLDEKE